MTFSLPIRDLYQLAYACRILNVLNLLAKGHLSARVKVSFQLLFG
jgi:hypothetical protein